MDDPQTHGLVHKDTLLAALPVLNDCPKARLLDAAQFAAMHTAHIVAHPPDGVLFPFLHGLEGDNHAQNTFFAAPARRRPPRFRGLVWVVADDDADVHAHAPATPATSFSEEDEDESFSDDDDDDDDEEEDDDADEAGELPAMDVDDVRIVRGGGADEHEQPDGDDGKHMHPVHHRAAIQLQSAVPSDAIPMEM